MGSLRSALDELRAEDLAGTSAEELSDGLRELERASRVIGAERSRRLAEVERRGTWSVDGHLSVVSWFAATMRVGFTRASREVKRSRALQDMPVTALALGDGELSPEAVELLVGAREAAPEAFREAEPMLVEAAVALPPRELRIAVAYWRQLADAAGEEERERRRYEGRRLHVSALMDGMVRVDGELDPESGQTVITALRCVQDAWARDGEPDGRTAPQRRADALVALCRSWLDRSDRPEVAGERPHVVVTVDLPTLERRAGRRSQLEDTGPVTPETARRLACDAGVSRVITAGSSEPLDVGRKTPVVPAGIRRALVVRDGGCRFPGCGRPQAWCDAHHVVHWADGGETSLANLVLLCRPHHRAVHGEFRVAMHGHGAVFSRADGSRLGVPDRAPPARAS
jgi:hypothetical protein